MIKPLPHRGTLDGSPFTHDDHYRSDGGPGDRYPSSKTTSMSRINVLLELAVDAKIPAGTPRAQRVLIQRQRADAAKREILRKIEALRSTDPHLQIRLQNTIFPILGLETTQEVVDELACEPGIVRIGPAPDFQFDQLADRSVG